LVFLWAAEAVWCRTTLARIREGLTISGQVVWKGNPRGDLRVERGNEWRGEERTREDGDVV
jgi:hypothetical protein